MSRMTDKIISDAVEKTIAKFNNRLSTSYKRYYSGKNKNGYYTRTGQVEAALSSYVYDFNGYDIEGSLYDMTKIHPFPDSNKYKFNHHMNWDRGTTWNGFYVPYSVPYWLNDGFTIVYGKRRTEYIGTHYMEDALDAHNKDEVEKKLTNEVFSEILHELRVKKII